MTLQAAIEELKRDANDLGNGGFYASDFKHLAEAAAATAIATILNAVVKGELKYE